ncbi:MAG: flavodoxin family protein [Candidatus Peribacteraceae bacterium]|nr:flavodoxin family protein [Candidatus Peribacteraceae bacterium]
MSSLHIIYASTSGHTEFTVETLAAFLREQAPDIAVEVQRAESAQPEDLKRGDALLLASGTWNTGGVEGQLNPHMYDFLVDRATNVDLGGKPVALIALGDTRYHYTARAAEHLQQFRIKHNGTQLLPPFVLVNEPYGQEEKIRAWGGKLIAALHGKKGG